MDHATVTVYADYACPFCYLGRTSLARYREEREDPLDVEWHPFDLLANRRDESGDLVSEMEMDEAYLEQAWGNVQQLAEEYGVEVPEDPITDTDSLRAQQVSLSVQEHRPDDWVAFDARLYDAVWRDDLDVSDPDVLEEVAAETGLEADVVGRALADADLRSRLEEHFAAARRRGITGVPTFVSGEHAARGAVPPEQLRRLIEGTD